MTPRKPLLLIALLAGAAVALLALLIANPLDGQPRGELYNFIGRFHPVVLHLPIGFISLLAVFEFLALFKRGAALKPAVSVTLGLSIASTLAAVATGFLLAWAAGSNEPLVQEHFRLGLLLGIGCLALGILKACGGTKILNTAYWLALLLNIGLLVTASHHGGSITHGSEYLTQHMPNNLRSVFGVALKEIRQVDSVENLVIYADLVHPIVEQKCLSCHNPDKLKGELDLSIHAGFLKGGDMGPAVVPHDLEASEFVYRITLEMDDPDFMPPEGKPALDADEVALLTWWIERGASPTATLGEQGSLPSPIAQYASRVFSSLRSPAEIARAEKEHQELAADLAKLAEELGIHLAPLDNDSRQYSLNTFAAQKRFDIAALKKLAPYGPAIVLADLSGTGLNDDAIAVLAQFPNLTALNLSKTKITGKNLSALAKLKRLENLNIYGAPLLAERIDELAKLSQLKRLYVFQTPLGEPAQIERLRSNLIHTQVN